MTKKANFLVPMTGTVVVRDGKRVKPVIGKGFQFEEDEIEQLTNMGAKFRKPTDETEAAEAPAAASSAEGSQARARGGKKAATAAKSDAEAAGDTKPPAGEGGGAGAGSDDDL